MDVINLYQYTNLFVCINILEFIVGVFMIALPSKKEWWNHIICFYGGFLFGLIPFFSIFGNITVAMISCILLSVVLICAYHYFKQKWNLALAVVIFKIILISGVTLCSEEYLSNGFRFYLISMLVSVFVFCMLSMIYELPSEKQYWVSGLFGLMEMSGAVLQFYRIDYGSFNKDLLSGENVSCFLYFLKADFWIFDYQSLFVICFLGLLCFYLVWRKVLSYGKRIFKLEWRENER